MCNCVWFILHCYHPLIFRTKIQNIITRMFFTMSPGETIWKAVKTWRAFSVCNMSAAGSLTGTLEPGTFPFGQSDWSVNHRDLFSACLSLLHTVTYWVTSMQSLHQVLFCLGALGEYIVYIYSLTYVHPKKSNYYLML